MVLNIAHRGARSLAPENTLPAIEKAWNIGADIVEIDVSVTVDGVLVLLHDNNLIRTTDVCKRFPGRMQQPCSAFTLKEIRSLDAGSWFITSDPFGLIAAGDIPADELASFKGLTIPTLEEVLRFVHERSWRVNIEIKKLQTPMEAFPVTEAVLDLIDRMEIPASRLIISSFVHDYIRKVQSKRPDIEINALIGGPDTESQSWGEYEFSIVNAEAQYTDEKQLARAREHGCLVNLYTVNNQDEMLRFIRAGVRGLFTDFPQILSRLQKQSASRHRRPEHFLHPE